MRKDNIIVILFLSFLSCNENTGLYEYLVFRNNNIKIWTNPITENLKQNYENGSWTINDEKGNILAEGHFQSGFKKGKWTYFPLDTLSIDINWKKYDSNAVEINFPSSWRIIESYEQERPFQAEVPTISKKVNDKCFLIITYSKDSILLDLEKYWEEYKNTTFDTEVVKEFALFSLLSSDNNLFYFSRYIIHRGEEEMLILSFIGETEKNIYDITLSSLNTEYEKKHIIFFDMLRSLKINEKRFFSPFDPIIKMKNLNSTSPNEKLSSAYSNTTELSSSSEVV